MKMINNKKLRGGYYTPKPIADFLTRWAIRSSTDTILEPSCGDGVLLESSVKVLRSKGASYKSINNQLLGIELIPSEANKSRLNVSSIDNSLEPNIQVGDFFSYCKSELFKKNHSDQVDSNGRKFSVVIGNPPFIRYQNFPEEHRAVAFKIMEEAGFNPTRLSNAWLPFLIVSTLLLNDTGRLALVIPAELFQVGYAAEARRLLSDCFSKLTIVTFKELVFPGIQQEIILLLGEHNGKKGAGIKVLELDNLNDLEKVTIKSDQNNEYKPMDHSTEKWTQYFLDKEEIFLLRKLRNYPGIVNSGDVIQVDVGVVTGNNKYFLLSDDQVREFSIKSNVIPIVTRSAHLKGVVFNQEDWDENLSLGYPSYLFTPLNIPVEKQKVRVKEYIQIGMDKEVHTGYKCRIRKNWYIVPSVWKPDAFMLRQVHSFPKLILNNSDATSTDTIHRVKFINGYSPRLVIAGFINSLTFAFSEVTGRSYGGGVLTFEPSETEKLPLPMNNIDQLDLNMIDEFVRRGEIENVLDITDQVLLIDGLGLSKKDVKILRRIWHKMKDRRQYRKHSR